MEIYGSFFMDSGEDVLTFTLTTRGRPVLKVGHSQHSTCRMTPSCSNCRLTSRRIWPGMTVSLTQAAEACRTVVGEQAISKEHRHLYPWSGTDLSSLRGA